MYFAAVGHASSSSTTDATIGGYTVTQLAGDTVVNSSTGRMFVLNDFPILANCTLTAMKLRMGTATSCYLSLWRAGTRIWQSSLITGLSAGLNTVSISASAQRGDLVGIWLPTGFVTIEYRNMTTVSTLYGADATGAVTSTSGFSSITGAIAVEAIATAPMLAVTGDSIAEGHSAWHGPMHDTTQGGTIARQPGWNIANTKGWGYQNHALGSRTFAWVAATGAPSAFNSGATHVLIHCGVNDIAGGITWASVLTNLNTILGLKPANTRLYIDEILPANTESDAFVATARLWNGYLATWCAANSVTLVACHDMMGQTRVSTGQLDDLLAAYNDDGIHLTQAGVNTLAWAFNPVAPIFTAVPTISGVANRDSTLTVTSGSVLGGAITSTYQWYANSIAIVGATATTYLVLLADVGKTITCEQTATNSVGSTTSTSAATTTITDLPYAVDFDGSTGYVSGTPQNVFSGATFSIGVVIDADGSSGYIASMNSTSLLIAYSGSNITFGNGTGWAEWTAGNGTWRFIHDRTQAGFARLIAYKNGVLQTQVATNGTYADFSPPNGVLEFGRRTSGTGYYNGRLSGIKVWSRACLPADSDQASNLTLNLQTIASTTWDDISSNNTDYTLTGGTTAV